jgi:hypothetical protein
MAAARDAVQGAATVRQLLPGVVGVFLVAESEAQLVQRLAARKTEPMDKLRTRVQTARCAQTPALTRACAHTHMHTTLLQTDTVSWSADVWHMPCVSLLPALLILGAIDVCCC